MLKQDLKMFKRFLNGFITIFPFYYKNNNNIKHYPDDIFVNDWKIIGNLIYTNVRNKIKEVEKNDK